MNTAALLAGIDLFRGLDPTAIAALSDGAVARSFGAGTMLWNAGETDRGLFVVLEGRVRVVGLRRDRQYSIHTEHADGTLGEVPLFLGGDYPATAISASPVRCLIIDAASLRRAMAADVELSWRLVARLSRRVQVLLARLQGLATGTVRNRTAAYLLAQAALAPGRVVNLGGTQELLAEELGTVREMVAREMVWLRDQGIVRLLARGRFGVLDEARLEELVEQPRGDAGDRQVALTGKSDATGRDLFGYR